MSEEVAPVSWDDKAPVNVWHSSVVSDLGAGWGVYAGKHYKAGDLMPYQYPGKWLTGIDYERLNRYLSNLTQKSNTISDSDRSFLCRFYGIWFKGDRITHADAVYDTFISYTFEVEWTDRFYFTDHYDGTTGAIVVDGEDEDVGFYMNEPPITGPYFYNICRRDWQPSEANVAAVPAADGGIAFVATKRIRPCDEILLDYGPHYNRSGYSAKKK